MMINFRYKNGRKNVKKDINSIIPNSASLLSDLLYKKLEPRRQEFLNAAAIQLSESGIAVSLCDMLAVDYNLFFLTLHFIDQNWYFF